MARIQIATLGGGATTEAQETAQNAALGNASAENPAVARNDPTVDLSVQSAAAQAGLSGASLNAGTVTASEGGDTAQLEATGIVTINAQEIDLKAIPEDASPDNPVAKVGITNLTKAASATLTVAELCNTQISNAGQSADMTLGFPTAVGGINSVVDTATTGHIVDLDPGASACYLDGTLITPGNVVRLATPAVRDQIAITTVLETDGTTWAYNLKSQSGFWDQVTL